MQFRLGNIIKRGEWILLIILLFLVCGAAFMLPGLTVNQDYNDYLPKHDESLEFYQEFSGKMGSEDDMMMITLTPPGGIFRQDFLLKLDSFALILDSLSEINSVLSLTNLERQVYVPGKGVVNIPFINLGKPESYSKDSSRIMEDPRFRNWLISEDANTIILLLFLKKDISSKSADHLISVIDHIASEKDMKNMHKLGRLFWEVSYNRIANRELKKGFFISILLICITMLLIYRSWRILMIMLTIYLLSGTVLFGYMAIQGRELNAMSNLIPVILLIVSISDVIHILEKYKIHEDKDDQRERIIYTLNDVGLSVFLTSLTTSIGFLTFGLSPVISVRNFGLDMGIGVILTFFISVLCIHFFMRITKIRLIRRNPLLERTWEKIAGRVSSFLLGRTTFIPVLCLVILIVSAVLIMHIDRNNYVASSMSSKNPLSKDVHFFDTRLGGARTFEFAVISEDSGEINWLNMLHEIKKVHDYLESHKSFGAVMSTATFYESVYNVIHPSRTLRLPESTERLREAESIISDQLGLFSIHLIDSERTTGRITGRMFDSGRLNVTRTINETTDWIEANTDTALVKFIPTGSMMITDKVQQSTIENLIIGLVIAILAISFVMALAFCDLRFVLITILANVFPIIVVAGLMPLYHIQLRYGTSIIFTIGFVIAIDDTIHFISNFRLLAEKGYKPEQRIPYTLKYAGKAIAITSMVLFLAFITLVFSEFKDSFAIGALLGSMIIIALLTDLWVLPWMLMKWIPGK